MIDTLFFIVQAIWIGILVLAGALAFAGTLLFVLGKMDQEGDNAGEE